MTPSFETSVVIVTFNSEDDIAACLDQLAGGEGLEIVVVDNASSDSTPEMLRRFEQRGAIDVLVLSESNDGFAKAVNAGIRASHGRDVFLLNPDAQIDGASVVRLREAARNDPRIGIIAPLVESGPTVAVMAAGRQPTLWPLFTHFSGLARAFPRWRALRGRHLYMGHHSSVEQDVEWVSGCALYVTEPALSTVGLLSERWFMYGEDIEFAHRVSLAGYRVVVTPSVKATHLIGSSVNKAGGKVSTMWAVNTYDYYVREFHAGPVRRFVWRGIFSGGLLSRALLFRLRGMKARSLREEYDARAERFENFAGAVWKKGTPRD
ncbi:glycosyltransferase family 2 protein [Herbiconiux sp.]|uniref:glycosyltransferase family 2 protein n=1 Tax=Herbiconiux sp. TaxID=1871186 RepID=UPI0025C69011|nr:glycosyltransferase family 2 protein [Herbiconiux sp.]